MLCVILAAAAVPGSVYASPPLPPCGRKGGGFVVLNSCNRNSSNKSLTLYAYKSKGLNLGSSGLLVDRERRKSRPNIMSKVKHGMIVYKRQLVRLSGNTSGSSRTCLGRCARSNIQHKLRSYRTAQSKVCAYREQSFCERRDGRVLQSAACKGTARSHWSMSARR